MKKEVRFTNQHWKLLEKQAIRGMDKMLYPQRVSRRYKKYVGVFLVALLFGATSVMYASSAPGMYPRGEIVTIEKDATVSSVAHDLKEKGAIRSSFLYKLYVVLFNNGLGVQEGDYLLDKPESAFRVAFRTAYGRQNLEKVKITIPEGSSSKEIASIVKKYIPEFDTESFLATARAAEGYLFPETYFFNERVRPSTVVKTMRDVFEEKMAEIEAKLDASDKSFDDIITMASILEEEENNTEDRRIISGILWKRIAKGMPLQIDAPFYYLYSKGSSQLTTKDLAEKSPYNTYVNKGLPPGPISNPSLDAILAALEPVETKYWFYLSDRTGKTHYAATHDDHVANKFTYLK